MDDKNGFLITNRDHVLRAWQNSTELVRDFREYSCEMAKEDKKLSRLFSEFAEDESFHAAKLLEILKKYDSKQ